MVLCFSVSDLLEYFMATAIHGINKEKADLNIGVWEDGALEYYIVLYQGSPNYGSRARSVPPRHFVIMKEE